MPSLNPLYYIAKIDYYLFKKISDFIVNLGYKLGYNKESSNKFSVRKDYFYNLWMCKKFECKNVIFKRKVNYLKGIKYIKIGEGTVFGKMAVITAWNDNPNQIEIGKNCNFGDYIHLTAYNHIKIGDNILTGRWVTITDNSHGETTLEDLKMSPIVRKIYSKGPVIIEDNVWIGDKVTILPCVTIGKCSVIAANSVVTKNIPPYSIAGGNPAKIIKSYSAQIE